MDTAVEWIATDSCAVEQDIERLGVSGAAEYQLPLIAEAIERGDRRWIGVTYRDMVAALRQIGGDR